MSDKIEPLKYLKYLEGNYSESASSKEQNEELLEDVEQAKALVKAEEYLKVYMRNRYTALKEHHYLVGGAVLKCTRCTLEPQTPIDKEFTAPIGSDKVILKVTQNTSYHNGAEQYFATLNDSKMTDNIEFFGNCLNPPDREEEKKKIEEADDSLRKKGTCQFLMKLNKKWENLMTGRGYEEVRGEDGELVETITMESILFCKHGGLIYPIDPGYDMTKILTREEREFADAFGLSEEQRQALFDIRKYMEENPKLAETTTIFAFEGLGTFLEEGEDNYWNGRNSYHLNGQFGAMLIVTKGGELSYAETRASTLPDNLDESATVKEGIYSVVPIPHKLRDTDRYAALQLRDENNTNNGAIPAYNSQNGNGTIVGDNLHMAGKIMSNEPVYSEGCITVAIDGYRDFGVNTGFIKDSESNVIPPETGYKEARKYILYDENIIDSFSGYIVIDREYCSDDIRKKLEEMQ